MRSLYLFLFYLIFFPSYAGGDGVPMGARFAGMGHTGITLSDLWGIRLNPAGIAGLDRPAAGIFHQRHFLMEELSDQAIVAAIPIGSGCFGFGADRFGYALYNETRASLAYAMRFGEGLRAAVQLDHFAIRLGENYGNTSTMIAEVGMQAKLSEKIWMGAHLYNPFQAALGGPYNDRVPTILSAGITYNFSEQLLMNAEVEKDMDQEERYRCGLEYSPNKSLFLRTGISTAPVQAHFGAGLRHRQLEVDLAITARSQLGATPMIGLNYKFK